MSSVNKAGLLIGAPTDDRFEISEAIESLLPLELLKELLGEPAADQRHRGRAADDALFDGEPERPEAGRRTRATSPGRGDEHVDRHRRDHPPS